MDQIAVGKFIQTKRKEKGMTQRELAEKLDVSDKAVSKWETGNGLPDVGLMLPLCDILGVSVNELLAGRCLNSDQYYGKAEENIVELIREKQEAKKKIILTCIIVMIDLLASVTLVIVAGMPGLQTWLRVLLVAIALVIVIMGIGVACVLDRDAGVFECPHCGERFVPTMKSYIMGPHTILRRKLKCPKCGARSFCRRRLAKKD